MYLLGTEERGQGCCAIRTLRRSNVNPYGGEVGTYLLFTVRDHVTTCLPFPSIIIDTAQYPSVQFED